MDVLGIKASEANQIVDPYLGVEPVGDDTTNLRKLVERYLMRAKTRASDTDEVVVSEARPPAEGGQAELFGRAGPVAA